MVKLKDDVNEPHRGSKKRKRVVSMPPQNEKEPPKKASRRSSVGSCFVTAEQEQWLMSHCNICTFTPTSRTNRVIDPFAWKDTGPTTENLQIPKTVLRHVQNAKSEHNHAGEVLFQSDMASFLIRRPILALKGDQSFKAEYTQWKANKQVSIGSEVNCPRAGGLSKLLIQTQAGVLRPDLFHCLNYKPISGIDKFNSDYKDKLGQKIPERPTSIDTIIDLELHEFKPLNIDNQKDLSKLILQLQENTIDLNRLTGKSIGVFGSCITGSLVTMLAVIRLPFHLANYIHSDTLMETTKHNVIALQKQRSDIEQCIKNLNSEDDNAKKHRTSMLEKYFKHGTLPEREHWEQLLMEKEYILVNCFGCDPDEFVLEEPKCVSEKQMLPKYSTLVYPLFNSIRRPIIMDTSEDCLMVRQRYSQISATTSLVTKYILEQLYNVQNLDMIDSMDGSPYNVNIPFVALPIMTCQEISVRERNTVLSVEYDKCLYVLKYFSNINDKDMEVNLYELFKNDDITPKLYDHIGRYMLIEQGYPAFTAEMSGDELRQCLRSLTELVFKLHKRTYVHGDLKPSNVLKLSDGSIRLIDFEFTAKSGIPIIGGTSGYKAYEILRGEAKLLNTAQDMWSLGIIIAEWVYDADVNEWTDISVIEEDARNWGDTLSKLAVKRDISNGHEHQIVGLISGLLQLDPSKRMTAEQTFQHPLLRL